ncbi:4Fe-4S dicluster domain-containing protein [Anoxybacterium hadale]|uniref:4Fe-4S dicluster domain-containing protein n=1 Tax=Anoxybacterium hadale TaxID=3408580 RepID=A0ACD1AAQ5_9FIRM|nr:4Fe-4S dicluster domain-containing protein [Clostridiales bacterium]
MKIVVGQGSCGIASGAKKAEAKFKKYIEENNLNAEVTISGCIGSCYLEPIVDVIDENGALIRYVHLTSDKVERVVREHLIGGKPVEEYLIPESGRYFLEKQTRIALKNCGIINPENIEDYVSAGGYQALKKALFEMDGDQICREIEKSGLRGRGGGGFPTGKKWVQVKSQKEPVKYIVCNGDEGDPGAFMDRSVMEGDPHKMLEGMIIAGIATGAQVGYIYVRAEYPLAVHRLQVAIAQAEKAGYLGEDILNSGFNFSIRINLGAGAFVCGEGSALTASIEGNRGMPRVKPPRTVEQGLFGKPTVLNNVETFAHVSYIILNGAEGYRKIGIEKSPGTKAFALTGNVNNTGLIEVPMGTPLRTVIFDIGGGVRNGKSFKAVQIGGPSGGCLTEKHLDMSLDFDSLTKAGAMIGSGGLVVMDEDTCMVSIAKFFMNFTEHESCGKCVPCREGTHVMNEILDDIVNGRGSIDQIDLLLDLADTITNTALCGLGKTAASPVVSTIREFKDEYEAHVIDKYCPTGSCQGLKRIVIDADKCKGCSKCQTVCPVNAITGERKKPYLINLATCIKCKRCIDSCPFKAIVEN